MRSSAPATEVAHAVSIARGRAPAIRPTGPVWWLRRNFYVTMAAIVVATVAYGFSQTFSANLEHPPYPRPWILYVHATVFPLWILLFAVQTALVRSGYTRVHRIVGSFGLALSAVLPVVAIATALVMDRLHALHGEQPTFFAAFFVVHVNDEMAFVVLMGLAAFFRRKPAVHARLVFVTACILMDSPFSRFPLFQARPFAITLAISYACADLLIFCGMARDWIVDGRIGVVYRFALPALVVGQVITTLVFAAAPPLWMAIAHRLIGA